MSRKFGGYSGVSNKVAGVEMDAGPITMGAYAVAVESAAAEARSFAQREGYLMVVGGGMASIMNSMISYI